MLMIIAIIVAVLSGIRAKAAHKLGDTKRRNTLVVYASVSALLAIYGFLLLNGTLTT